MTRQEALLYRYSQQIERQLAQGQARMQHGISPKMAIRKPYLRDFIPEGKSGNVEIRYFTVSTYGAQLHNLKVWLGDANPCDVTLAGDYVTLEINEQTMMSDSLMEWRTGYELVQRARGRVLIGGLGLGLMPIALRDDPRVTQITIIEKNAHVIKLVEPHIQHPKIRVLHKDIFNYMPSLKFDTIWMDIWPMFSEDNLPEMDALRKKYTPRLRPDGWFKCWGETRIRRHALQDKLSKIKPGSLP